MTRARATLRAERARSELELTLSFQLRALGVEPWEPEYVFAPPRKFRADFGWPAHKLLVEIEGGIYSHGAHARPRGIERDMEKANLAASLGYRLFRYGPHEVESGEAAQEIEELLREERHG